MKQCLVFACDSKPNTISITVYTFGYYCVTYDTRTYYLIVGKPLFYLHIYIYSFKLMPVVNKLFLIIIIINIGWFCFNCSTVSSVKNNAMKNVIESVPNSSGLKGLRGTLDNF